MSRELMKMVGVSVCSSLCTAVFVVACTAAADKVDDDERGSGEELAEDGGGSGGDEDDGDGPGDGGDDDDGDGPGDGGDDDDNGSGDDDDDGDLADLVTQVGEMATQIEELVAFQTSALYFIGHMTDDQSWIADERSWRDLDEHGGTGTWQEGSNSDAQQAYDDCF
jgi:hypothetical protein